MVKGWFPRRKPMGSFGETSGFLTGTHRFPTELIVIPGIGQNEKDKAMGLEPIREDRKTKACLLETWHFCLVIIWSFSKNVLLLQENTTKTL